MKRFFRQIVCFLKYSHYICLELAENINNNSY